MDIQFMHMQNNFYRDLITQKKREINELDNKIQANEIEIGQQLTIMERLEHESWERDPHMLDCTLCMGSCDTVEE